MFKYTKYLTNNIFIGATVLGFILGGHWMWLGFVFAIVGGVGGDFLLGDHGEAPEYTYPHIYPSARPCVRPGKMDTFVRGI